MPFDRVYLGQIPLTRLVYFSGHHPIDMVSFYWKDVDPLLQRNVACSPILLSFSSINASIFDFYFLMP
jgi:hypothetical protein